MDGTGTYGVQFRDVFVPDELILADQAGPFVKKIRAGFILLQAGMALGVMKDCINIMDEVDAPLGHVNRYLPQQPVQFRELAAELEKETMALARDPYNDEETYWRRVIALRLRAAMPASRRRMRRCCIAARAVISKSHRAQRRLREAYFVAIVTPATKQLRKMLGRGLSLSQSAPPKTTNLNRRRLPQLTDVLISASELRRSLEDRALCRHRHPQSRRLWRRASAQRRQCARHLHLPRDLDAGRHQRAQDQVRRCLRRRRLSGKETAVIYEQSMNSGFGQSCRGYYLLTMLGYPQDQGAPWRLRCLGGGGPAGDHRRRRCRRRRAFSIVPEAGDILIDAKTMLAAVGKPGVAHSRRARRRRVDRRQLLALWQGFLPAQGPHPRRGVAREWYRMMKPTGGGPRFKSKDEILAECATVGISQTTPVYLYCFKGARASNTFLALKNAGVKDVRMYFGSWNEWSRDPALPIEQGLPTAARVTGKAA